MVNTEPKQTFTEFEAWNNSKNIWKARASLVPFAQCKMINKHISIVLIFSECLIERDEWFCKTATGWDLRQYSKIEDNIVIDFWSETRIGQRKKLLNMQLNTLYNK